MFDLVEALDSTTRCPRRSTGRRCADLERAFERLDDELEPDIRARQHVRERDEALHLARHQLRLHRDARGLERDGVLLSLVAQHVVLGEEHQLPTAGPRATRRAAARRPS